MLLRSDGRLQQVHRDRARAICLSPAAVTDRLLSQRCQGFVASVVLGESSWSPYNPRSGCSGIPDSPRPGFYYNVHSRTAVYCKKVRHAHNLSPQKCLSITNHLSVLISPPGLLGCDFIPRINVLSVTKFVQEVARSGYLIRLIKQAFFSLRKKLDEAVHEVVPTQARSKFQPLFPPGVILWVISEPCASKSGGRSSLCFGCPTGTDVAAGTEKPLENSGPTLPASEPPSTCPPDDPR